MKTLSIRLENVRAVARVLKRGVRPNIFCRRPSRSQPNPARGSGERCKLPQRGLGRSPRRSRIWCILDLKGSIWCYIYRYIATVWKYLKTVTLITGGSRNSFGGANHEVPNRKLRAKPESRAQSARELWAKPKPRAKPEEKRGEGSGEGARWAPPQKNFEKSNLKTFILVHIWSNLLKWLYIERNGLIAHFHAKSLVIIWCDGIIQFCSSIKLDRGKQKLFSF